MKNPEIDLILYHRTTHTESVEERHAEVMRNLSRVGPPFGLKGMPLPPTPTFGSRTVTGYVVKLPTPGVRFEGIYKYRKEGHHPDKAAKDDMLSINFKRLNKNLDYRWILQTHFPELIAAFVAYRATVTYDLYSIWYTGGSSDSNEAYNCLIADKSIDVDGRNNIFTLEPAMYWDALLCRRALGYGPEEVIRRLQGKVPRVMPLMDGVYTVFSDDPDLSYEEFVALNDEFKPILGLI